MKNISFSLFLLFFLFNLNAQNENISNGNVFDGEPFIIVNPYNNDNIVIAWLGFTNLTDYIQIKTRTSFDGGLTWNPIVSIPHAESYYTNAADPCMAFNKDGDLFLAYINSNGSSSDPFYGAIYVCKSTDGGLTWENPVEVVNYNIDPDRVVIDRPWIAIDRSNDTATQGNIYITSMNAKTAIPDYHPYISISTDNGNSFTFKELDDTNWLSGNYINQPMPTPDVNSDGVLAAVYPSYVPSQNLFAQYVFAKSTDGGNSFSYNTVFTTTGTNAYNENTKNGYLLKSNPSNPNHYILLYPTAENNDIDIFMRESIDGGLTWSSSIRVNDDPINNGKIQDLVWADFNEEGDIIVSWRDRRNGADSTYLTSSEIWAAYRDKDSTNFESNFQITDQLVDFDSILLEAGNDFMGINLIGDDIHVTWGDPRTNRLNIWYQKMTLEGTISSTFDISNATQFKLYPNPSNTFLNIEADDVKEIEVYNTLGELVTTIQNITNPSVQIDISNWSNGNYIIHITNSEGLKTTQQFTKY